MTDFEEGQQCPKCLTGTFKLSEVVGCSCHINPPCTACVNNTVECNFCGFTPDDIMEESE